MTKLTKRFVDAIIPDPKETLKFWDTELKGFGVIVLPSGRRTYCVEYRNAYRIKKRLKLGVHGVITAEQARDLARDKLHQVTQGEDPADIKQALRESPNINDLANDYLEIHAVKKRPKSILEDKKLLSKVILPVLGKQIVANVTRRSLEAFHRSQEKTPYQANRALALLSKMFSLALQWNWRTDNPALGIQKFQEAKRDRWLDESELGRLWEVLDRYPTHTTALAIKFLALTGARKGEALNAAWDQFDLEKGIWTKPSHLTKQKRKEHLPLSSQAIAVLITLKGAKTCGTGYVFQGRKQNTPLTELKTFWKRILKEANLEEVRIHDLRHTHASHLVSNGLSLSIVGKLLGHTQASTTQRYAHLADAPLRQAADLFGSIVGNMGGSGEMNKEQMNV